MYKPTFDSSLLVLFSVNFIRFYTVSLLKHLTTIQDFYCKSQITFLNFNHQMMVHDEVSFKLIAWFVKPS